MSTYVFAKNGMGSYTAGTGMREDMLMQVFNIYNYQAGIILSDDYEVTENSPQDMSVDVAAGRCFITNSSYVVNTANSTKFWGLLNDAVINVPISTNTSGSTRIDKIVAKIDPAAAPGSYATGNGSVIVVEGTPGAGAPATPANCLLLATLTIPTGTTTQITNAMIADNRVFCGQKDSIGLLATVPDSNGNLLYYNSAGTLTQVYVPTTGSLEAAVITANGTAPIILSAGTHALSDTLALSILGTKIYGAGRNITTIDASPITGAAKDVIEITSYSNDLRGFAISCADASVDTGIRVNKASVGYGSHIMEDIAINSVDTGKTGLIFSGANIAYNNSIRDIFITCTAGTGAGLNIDYVHRSFFKNIFIDVDAGAHWDLDSNTSRNFLDVICDVAGTDNGAGNNIREVVF